MKSNARRNRMTSFTKQSVQKNLPVKYFNKFFISGLYPLLHVHFTFDSTPTIKIYVKYHFWNRNLISVFFSLFFLCLRSSLLSVGSCRLTRRLQFVGRIHSARGSRSSVGPFSFMEFHKTVRPNRTSRTALSKAKNFGVRFSC